MKLVLLLFISGIAGAEILPINHSGMLARDGLAFWVFDQPGTAYASRVDVFGREFLTAVHSTRPDGSEDIQGMKITLNLSELHAPCLDWNDSAGFDIEFIPAFSPDTLSPLRDHVAPAWYTFRDLYIPTDEQVSRNYVITDPELLFFYNEVLSLPQSNHAFVVRVSAKPNNGILIWSGTTIEVSSDSMALIQRGETSLPRLTGFWSRRFGHDAELVFLSANGLDTAGTAILLRVPDLQVSGSFDMGSTFDHPFRTVWEDGPYLPWEDDACTASSLRCYPR